jgi:hypothetical protein
MRASKGGGTTTNRSMWCGVVVVGEGITRAGEEGLCCGCG